MIPRENTKHSLDTMHYQRRSWTAITITENDKKKSVEMSRIYTEKRSEKKTFIGSIIGTIEGHNTRGRQRVTYIDGLNI